MTGFCLRGAPSNLRGGKWLIFPSQLVGNYSSTGNFSFDIRSGLCNKQLCTAPQSPKSRELAFERPHGRSHKGEENGSPETRGLPKFLLMNQTPWYKVMGRGVVLSVLIHVSIT